MQLAWGRQVGYLQRLFTKPIAINNEKLEKKIQTNVVPRSTGNNRELTLKCKFKCCLNSWITHWALALVKGNREPHEAKKKSFDLGGIQTHDLRIRSTVTLPTELQVRTVKVGDDFRWWIVAKRK